MVDRASYKVMPGWADMVNEADGSFLDDQAYIASTVPRSFTSSRYPSDESHPVVQQGDQRVVVSELRPRGPGPGGGEVRWGVELVPILG